MNAKPEQIQTGSDLSAAEKTKLTGSEAKPPALTEVSNEELDRVEGGSGLGTRTGDDFVHYLHRR
jgi:hypothetical protein